MNPTDNVPFYQPKAGFNSNQANYYGTMADANTGFYKKGGTIKTKGSKKCSCGCAMKISKKCKRRINRNLCLWM